MIGSKTEEPKTAFADMTILHYPLSTDPIGMLLFISFRCENLLGLCVFLLNKVLFLIMLV